MGGELYLGQKPVDWDIWHAETAVVANTAGQSIFSETVKKGKKAFIVAYRQAWDATLDPDLYHSLRINGNPYHKFFRSRVQLAAPESDVFLAVPIPVEQGSIINMVADNDGSNAGNVIGRVIVYYYDPV